MLGRVARHLSARGHRLAGVVQVNAQYDALCACDMTLSDLATGAETRISQRLGRYARGCRLDHGALAAAGGRVEAGDAKPGVAGGQDLLIVNKFGKVEAAGGGFRAVIATAIGAGIPVLVGVSDTNLAAWQAFTGGAGLVLPARDQAVLDWVQDVLPQQRAIA